jgi:CheY-like chemotaxis protein
MDFIHQAWTGLAGEGSLAVIMGLTGAGLLLLMGLVLFLSLKRSFKKTRPKPRGLPQSQAEPASPGQPPNMPQPSFPVELFQDVVSRLARLETELVSIEGLLKRRESAPPPAAQPVSPEPAAEAPAAAAEAPPAAAAAPLPMTPKTAVICDDDGTLRQIYQHILKKQGFTVEAGADGQEGLNAIRSVRPSLVILDLDMPVKGGLAVLRELHGEGFVGPYIIILSARENPDLHAEVRALGASDVMIKPFSPPDLVKKIETLVQEGKI